MIKPNTQKIAAHYLFAAQLKDIAKEIGVVAKSLGLKTTRSSFEPSNPDPQASGYVTVTLPSKWDQPKISVYVYASENTVAQSAQNLRRQLHTKIHSDFPNVKYSPISEPDNANGNWPLPRVYFVIYPYGTR